MFKIYENLKYYSVVFCKSLSAKLEIKICRKMEFCMMTLIINNWNVNGMFEKILCN